MSHFAEIDENNIVLRVLVGDNNLPNEGYDWFIENLGGRWIQTSYNANFRKNFAGVGYEYREDLDAFIPLKPFDSWVLDEVRAQWDAPEQHPRDGLSYFWDEDSMSWKLLEAL